MSEAIKSAALCKRHSYAGVSGHKRSSSQSPSAHPLYKFLFTVPVHDLTKVTSEKGTTDFSQLSRAAPVWKIADCAETHTIASPRGSKCCFTITPEGLRLCRCTPFWGSPGDLQIQKKRTLTS